MPVSYRVCMTARNPGKNFQRAVFPARQHTNTTNVHMDALVSLWTVDCVQVR